jgi:hypothetical protein
MNKIDNVAARCYPCRRSSGAPASAKISAGNDTMRLLIGLTAVAMAAPPVGALAPTPARAAAQAATIAVAR